MEKTKKKHLRKILLLSISLSIILAIVIYGVCGLIGYKRNIRKSKLFENYDICFFSSGLHQNNGFNLYFESYRNIEDLTFSITLYKGKIENNIWGDKEIKNLQPVTTFDCNVGDVLKDQEYSLDFLFADYVSDINLSNITIVDVRATIKSGRVFFKFFE